MHTHEGTVLTVGETMTVGQAFIKRAIVLKDGTEQYPKGLPFEFTKEDTDLLDDVKVGDRVKISFFVEGSREWNGRYFASLHGKRIEVLAHAVVTGNNPKPVVGCTFETAKETWFKYHGDDLAGFAEFCRQRRPDMVKLAAEKKTRLSDILKTRLDVCADIVNAIEAAQNAAEQTDAAATDDEALPF